MFETVWLGDPPELGGPELAWEPPADGPPWSTYLPSSLLMQVLAAQPVEQASADQLIEMAGAWARFTGYAQAMQARVLARFLQIRTDEHGGEFARYAGDEIGPALGISRTAAADRLALAAALAGRLPATLAAMEAGEIDLAKARILTEVTANVSAEQATAVEAAVLPSAQGMTPRQLRAAAQRAVLQADPAGGAARHDEARAQRRVSVYPAEDGMAVLWALLPADKATAVRDRLGLLGRAAKTPGDERTADARRADALTDLLLAGPGGAPAVSTEVRVTVPATALAGADDAPGELAGYGPITAEQARALAADATWRRLLTDPASGALLDYGRTTYRPPAALADHVRARDKTCRFPGCPVPAHRSDLDHTVAYHPDGATADTNLGALCRHHHLLKQQPGWALTQDSAAGFEWTTPTGRRYRTEPEPLAPRPEPDPP